MKIVHEIYGIPTMSFTVREMATPIDRQPDWNGAYVDGIVSSGPTALKEECDSLYIEGTIESVREMCQGILEQLDFLEKDAMARVEELRQASKKCEICDGWYDTRQREPHGNGKGDGCLGDGTVMIGNCNVEVVYPAHRVTYVESLKRGERFKKIPASADKNAETFEAFEDPVKRGASWAVRARRVS